jgi:hypothetical protein
VPKEDFVYEGEDTGGSVCSPVAGLLGIGNTYMGDVSQDVVDSSLSAQNGGFREISRRSEVVIGGLAFTSR